MNFAPPGLVYGMQELSQSVESLSVGSKKKKRPQRAFHETGSAQPLQPPQFPNTSSPSLGSPMLNHPGSGNLQGQAQFSTPQLGSQWSQFGSAQGSPAAPVTPYGAPSPYGAPIPFGAPSPYGAPTYGAPVTPYGAGTQPGTPLSTGFPFNAGTPSQLGANPFASSSAIPQFSTPNLQTQRAGQMSSQPNNSDDLSVQAHRHINQLEYLPDETGQTRSFLTFNNVVPPDATSQFHAVDQGTALSKFIRSSMYYVPELELLRQATKLPLSITIRPFAPVLDTEEPIPVVDMKRATGTDESGPIRCRRCRTYINPSMQFTNLGKFTCNICQFPNNTLAADYQSALDHQNQRLDKFIRPELHKGVYDLLVPQEYNFQTDLQQLKPLHHVFLVDISEQSRKQNLPMLVADAIRAALYSEDVPTGRFSIIAFDKRIHFFNLLSSLESCQIVVSSDLELPFVPFTEGLFVDPEESRIPIEDALIYLEKLATEETMADTEPCFGAACRSAMMCLEINGGGKITALLAALPSWGPGGLKFKDNHNVGRTFSPALESKVLLADSEYYKALTADCIKHSVGLDVHVVSPTAVDLSNIGYLSSSTGGALTRWPNFDMERDGRNLLAHIESSVKNARGYQGQLKLRCLHGLQVAQYYCTSVSDSSDPIIPVLNEDQTITILLKYDGKLFTKYDAHFQAALLYTDLQGVRKVRVINLVLAVSERLEDVFNFVDENAVVTTIVRDTLSFIGKQTLRELRELVNEKLVEIFTQYRAMSELSRNAHQHNKLLFPDSISHLPIYLLAFTKSKVLRDSGSISLDARLTDLYQMLNMPVEKLLYRLYPALIEFHSIEETDCQFGEANGFFTTPRFTDLTLKNLEPGVYLMYNGVDIYVYVDAHANPLIIKDLFGEEIDDVTKISPLIDEFPDLDTHISQQARNLVRYFQTLNGAPTAGSAGIRIVRAEGSLPDFRDSLVEDSLWTASALEAGPAYPEFLSNLHKAIKLKLDNDKLSGVVKKSVAAAEHTNETLAQRLIHF